MLQKYKILFDTFNYYFFLWFLFNQWKKTLKTFFKPIKATLKRKNVKKNHNQIKNNQDQMMMKKIAMNKNFLNKNFQILFKV